MKMQLSINNFKSITNRVIILPLTGLVLLKGESGSGKSTALESIYKCLYAKRNSSQINLKTPSFSIERDRSRVFVTIEGKEYNGEEFIENNYGPETLWLCSSYLPQGQTHHLFTMDEGSKISLLSELAFDGTDGDIVISRCKEERKIEEENKTKKESEILIEKTLYGAFLKNNPSIKEGRLNPLPPDDIKEYKKDIRVWQKRIPKIQDQISKTHIELSTLRVQLKERSSLLSEISSLNDRTLEIQEKEKEQSVLLEEKEKWEIYNMRQKILKIDTPDPVLSRTHLDYLSGIYERHSSLLEILKEVKDKLPKKENELEDLKLFNKDNLILKKLSILDNCQIDDISCLPKAIETLKTRERLMKELETIKDPNPIIKECDLVLLPSIKCTIGDLKTSIESFIKFDLYNSYEKYLSLTNDIPNQEEDIKSLQEALQISELNEKCMNCPSCNKRLFIEKGKLRILESDITVDSASIRSLLKKAQENHELYKKSKEANTIIRELFPIVPEKVSRPSGQRYPESLLLVLVKYPLDVDIDVERKKVNEKKMYDSIVSRISYLESYPFTLEVAEKTRELTKDLPMIKSVKKEKEILESSFTGRSYTGTDTEKSLSVEISKLRSIESILHNLTIDTTIEEQYLHHSNNEERKKYPKGLKDTNIPLISYENVVHDLKVHQYEISQMKEETLKFQTLKKRIEALPLPLKEEELLSDLKLKEETLQEYKEGLLDTQNIIHMERLGTLEIQLRNIISLQDRYSKIEDIVKKSQKDLLESFLFTMSQNITEVLNEMRFEGPIRVEMSTVYEKKDGKESRKFNVRIYYKGMEYRYTDLSGGERSRFYLALTIAFSKMSGKKGGLLLIDETISTLDSVTRDKVVEIVKRHLPDKLIIVVNHDSSEGLYDDIISL